MIRVGTNQKSCIEDLGYNERMLLYEYLGEQVAFRQLLKDYIHIGSGGMRVVGEVQTWGQDSCQPCQPKPTTKKTARVTTRVGRMSSMAVAMASEADSESVSHVPNVHTVLSRKP